jgi:hypothetical protein
MTSQQYVLPTVSLLSFDNDNSNDDIGTPFFSTSIAKKRKQMPHVIPLCPSEAKD